jgi:hypothetical protein
MSNTDNPTAFLTTISGGAFASIYGIQTATSRAPCAKIHAIKKETTYTNASISPGNTKHACITFGETVGKKY